MAIVENCAKERRITRGGGLSTKNKKKSLNYKLFNSLPAFSFYMPEGWNDENLKIFFNSCRRHIKDLANPLKDVHSTWSKIAKYGAQISSNQSLFNVNNCIEVVDALKKYIYQNEKGMSDNETFVKFHEDIKDLLKYFETPNHHEQNTGEDLLEITLSQLIYQYLPLIHEGNPNVWKLLSNAISERISFNTNVQLFLEVTKRKIISLVEKEKDPLRKKEVFSQKTKNFMLEVFDYIAPTSVKKSDFLTMEQKSVYDEMNKNSSTDCKNESEVLKTVQGSEGAPLKEQNVLSIDRSDQEVEGIWSGHTEKINSLKRNSSEKEVRGIIEFIQPEERQQLGSNEGNSHPKEINAAEHMEKGNVQIEVSISNRKDIKIGKLGKILKKINMRLKVQSEKEVSESGILSHEKDPINDSKSSDCSERVRETEKLEYKENEKTHSILERILRSSKNEIVNKKAEHSVLERTIPKAMGMVKITNNDNEFKKVTDPKVKNTSSSKKCEERINIKIEVNEKCQRNTRNSEKCKEERGLELDMMDKLHHKDINSRSNEKSKEESGKEVVLWKKPEPKTTNKTSNEKCNREGGIEDVVLDNPLTKENNTRSEKNEKEGVSKINATERPHQKAINTKTRSLKSKEVKKVEVDLAEISNPEPINTRNKERSKKQTGIDIEDMDNPLPKTLITRSSDKYREVCEIEVSTKEKPNSNALNTRSNQRCEEEKGMQVDVLGKSEVDEISTISSVKCTEERGLEVDLPEISKPEPINTRSKERSKKETGIDVKGMENTQSKMMITRNNEKYKEGSEIDVSTKEKPNSKERGIEVEVTDNSPTKTIVTTSEKSEEERIQKMDMNKRPHPKTINTKRSSAKFKEVKCVDVNMMEISNPEPINTGSKEETGIGIEGMGNLQSNTIITRSNDKCKEGSGIEVGVKKNPTSISRNTRNSQRSEEERGIKVDVPEKSESNTISTKRSVKCTEERGIEVDVIDNRFAKVNNRRSEKERVKEMDVMDRNKEETGLDAEMESPHSEAIITQSNEKCKEESEINVKRQEKSQPKANTIKNNKKSKEGSSGIEVGEEKNPTSNVRNTRRTKRSEEEKARAQLEDINTKNSVKCTGERGIGVQVLENPVAKSNNKKISEESGINDVVENPHSEALNVEKISENYRKVKALKVELMENTHTNENKRETSEVQSLIEMDMMEDSHSKGINTKRSSEKYKEDRGLDIEGVGNIRIKANNKRKRDESIEENIIKVDMIEIPQSKGLNTRSSKTFKGERGIGEEVMKNAPTKAISCEKSEEEQVKEVNVMRSPRSKAINTKRSNVKFKEVKKVEVDTKEMSHPEALNTRSRQRSKEETGKDFGEMEKPHSITTTARNEKCLEESGIDVKLLKKPLLNSIKDTKVNNVSDENSIKERSIEADAKKNPHSKAINTIRSSEEYKETKKIGGCMVENSDSKVINTRNRDKNNEETGIDVNEMDNLHSKAITKDEYKIERPDNNKDKRGIIVNAKDIPLPKVLITRSWEKFKEEREIVVVEENPPRKANNARNIKKGKAELEIIADVKENPHPMAISIKRNSVKGKEIKRVEVDMTEISDPNGIRTRSRTRSKEEVANNIEEVENSQSIAITTSSNETCIEQKGIEVQVSDDPQIKENNTKSIEKFKDERGIIVNEMKNPEPNSISTRSSENFKEERGIEVEKTENSPTKGNKTRSSAESKVVRGMNVDVLKSHEKKPINTRNNDKFNDDREVLVEVVEISHHEAINTRSRERNEEETRAEADVGDIPQAKVINTRSSDKCKGERGLEEEVMMNPPTKDINISEKDREKEKNATESPHPKVVNVKRISVKSKGVKRVEVEEISHPGKINTRSRERSKETGIDVEEMGNLHTTVITTRNNEEYKKESGINEKGQEKSQPKVDNMKSNENCKGSSGIEVGLIEHSYKKSNNTNDAKSLKEKPIEVDAKAIKTTRGSENCKEIGINVMEISDPKAINTIKREINKVETGIDLKEMDNAHSKAITTRSQEKFKHEREIDVKVLEKSLLETNNTRRNSKCIEGNGVDVEELENPHLTAISFRSSDKCEEENKIEIDEKPQPRVANTRSNQEHTKRNIQIEIDDSSHSNSINTKNSERRNEICGIDIFKKTYSLRDGNGSEDVYGTKTKFLENSHPKKRNKKGKEIKENFTVSLKNTRILRSNKIENKNSGIEVNLPDYPIPKDEYTSKCIANDLEVKEIDRRHVVESLRNMQCGGRTCEDKKVTESKFNVTMVGRSLSVKNESSTHYGVTAEDIGKLWKQWKNPLWKRCLMSTTKCKIGNEVFGNQPDKKASKRGSFRRKEIESKIPDKKCDILLNEERGIEKGGTGMDLLAMSVTRRVSLRSSERLRAECEVSTKASTKHENDIRYTGGLEVEGPENPESEQRDSLKREKKFADLREIEVKELQSPACNKCDDEKFEDPFLKKDVLRSSRRGNVKEMPIDEAKKLNLKEIELLKENDVPLKRIKHLGEKSDMSRSFDKKEDGAIAADMLENPCINTSRGCRKEIEVGGTEVDILEKPFRNKTELLQSIERKKGVVEVLEFNSTMNIAASNVSERNGVTGVEVVVFVNPSLAEKGLSTTIDEEIAQFKRAKFDEAEQTAVKKRRKGEEDKLVHALEDNISSIKIKSPQSSENVNKTGTDGKLKESCESKINLAECIPLNENNSLISNVGQGEVSGTGNNPSKRETLRSTKAVVSETNNGEPSRRGTSNDKSETEKVVVKKEEDQSVEKQVRREIDSEMNRAVENIFLKENYANAKQAERQEPVSWNITRDEETLSHCNHSELRSLSRQSVNSIKEVNSRNIPSHSSEVLAQERSSRDPLNPLKRKMKTGEETPIEKKRRFLQRRKASPEEGSVRKRPSTAETIPESDPVEETSSGDVDEALVNRLRPGTSSSTGARNNYRYVKNRITTVRKVTTFIKQSTVLKKPFVRLIDISKDPRFDLPICRTITTSSQTSTSAQLTFTNVKKISFTSVNGRHRETRSTTQHRHSKESSEVPASSRTCPEEVASSTKKKGSAKLIKNVVKPFNYDSCSTSSADDRIDLNFLEQLYTVTTASNPRDQRTSIALPSRSESIDSLAQKAMSSWDKMFREHADMDSMTFQDSYLWKSAAPDGEDWLNKYLRNSKRYSNWRFGMMNDDVQNYVRTRREELQNIRREVQSIIKP